MILKSLTPKPIHWLSHLALSLLSAGGLWVAAPQLPLALAGESAVPEAELAIQPLLPAGARVVGSRRLSDQEAEIWVESRGEVTPVILRRKPSGAWEQDMRATLARAASQMHTLAQQQTLNRAFGQTAPDQAAPPPVPSLPLTPPPTSILIPLPDREQETQRALSGAGRADPFVRQNIRASEPEIPLPPPPPLPPLPPSGDGERVPVNLATPPSTPTPDPAAFARRVEVSGIVQIGGESFALVSAPGAVPSVVQAGQDYRTAKVIGVSAREQRVVLSEGGEKVVKRVGEIPTVAATPSP